MPRYKEEGVYEGEFQVSEAPGNRSRESGPCAAPAAMPSGRVVGKITRGAAAAVVAPVAGIVGNGVLTLAGTPVAAGAKAGTYRVQFVEPIANAGTFTVEGPDGVQVGAGQVGQAFAGPVSFTVADGATDFVAGDAFTVTVTYAAGSGRYAPWNPAATDGSEEVAGVLLTPYEPWVNGMGAVLPRQVTVFERDCEVDGFATSFPAGADAAATAVIRAAGIAGLARKGIRVR